MKLYNYLSNNGDLRVLSLEQILNFDSDIPLFSASLSKIIKFIKIAKVFIINHFTYLEFSISCVLTSDPASSSPGYSVLSNIGWH